MAEQPLPARRETIRQKVTVGGIKVYLDLGQYEDGRVGELFIVVEKTGAERRWFYDEVARLASKCLQYGLPLEQLGESWVGTKGKVCGPVRHDEKIRHATSVLDWVGRHLLVHYCGREELAHVKEAT